MSTDQILARYRGQIDDVLSGRGRVDSILRRQGIYDSLNSGRPSSVAATPRFSPAPMNMSGAPADSSQVLSDLMTFIGGLPSGAVGDQGNPANFAEIDATRAKNQIDVQKLLDARAVEEAGAINASNQDRDQINARLGEAGAGGILRAGEQEDAAQSSIDDIIRQAAGAEMGASVQAEAASSKGELDVMLGEWKAESAEKDRLNRLEVAGIGASGRAPARTLADKEAEWESQAAINARYRERPQTLADKEAEWESEARIKASHASPATTYKTLSDDEKTARGLPLSSVYQEDSLGYLDRVDGTAPSRTAEAVRKQSVALKDTRDAISGLRGKIKEHGVWNLPAANRELMTVYNNALLRAKDLYQLGALAGPDMGVLTDLIADPTSWRSWSADNILSQLDQVDGMIDSAEMNLGADAPEKFTRITTHAPLKGRNLFKDGL